MCSVETLYCSVLQLALVLFSLISSEVQTVYPYIEQKFLVSFKMQWNNWTEQNNFKQLKMSEFLEATVVATYGYFSDVAT